MIEVAKATFAGMLDNFPSLAIPSTLFATLLSYTGCSGEAFVLWVCISTLDMIFGVILSIVDKCFKVSKLYNWVFKIFIQLLTIVLFAAILRMVAITAGIELFVVSWLLLFFALMDFSSIMEKFLRLGYLPKPAQILLGLMRKRSAKVLAAMVNEPELEKQMREALGEKEKKVNLDKTPA